MSFTRHHEAAVIRQDERAVVCPMTTGADIRNQKPGTKPGVSQE